MQSMNCIFELEKGIYSRDGAEIKFLFKKSKNPEGVIVFLPGAYDRRKGVFQFQRHSWSEDYIDKYHCLYLDDPTVNESNNVSIGWFQGWRGCNLFKVISDVVRLIILKFNFSEKELIFFGSSAGGFASLKLIEEFSESTAIAINPQFYLHKFYEKQFKEMLLYSYREVSDDFLLELKKNSFSVNPIILKRNVFIFQNTEDKFHWNEHFLPFLNSINKRDSIIHIKSLENEENIISGGAGARFLSYSDPVNGHNPPNRYHTQRMIRLICLKDSDFLNKKMVNSITVPKYIRGFLVSTDADNVVTDVPSEWSFFDFLGMKVFYDKKNKIGAISKDGFYCLIIGSVLDLKNYKYGPEEVVHDIFDSYILGEDVFFNRVDWLNGRFVIIYGQCDSGEVKSLKVINDATGLRSVFYVDDNKENLYIGSHPELVAKQVGASRNNYDRFLKKYSGYSLPGNVTTFNKIKQLIPNHYLDSDERRQVRFFPRNNGHINYNIEDIIKDLALNLKGQIDFISEKAKLLCSISAGIDSRVTFSATRDSSEKIKYFTYYGKEINKKDVFDIDCYVANELAKNFGIDHKLINLSCLDSDEDIVNVAGQIKHASHIIHNPLLSAKYYKEFGENNFLHLRSNVLEIGRVYYKRAYSLPKMINEEVATNLYSLKAKEDQEVINLFKEFLNLAKYDLVEGYDCYDLFYWEYRMGVWHSLVTLESDLAFDTYIPFNNRIFLTKLLSIPQSLRIEDDVFLRICEENWPAVTFFGVNKKTNLLKINNINARHEKNAVNVSLSEFSSGSFSDPHRKPPFTFDRTDCKISFSFLESAPKKDDFVQFELKLDNSRKYNNIFIYLRTPHANQNLKGRVFYAISLNNIEILKSDISSWPENNQLIINLNHNNMEIGSEILLGIKIFAKRDCEPWNWGRASNILIDRISVSNFDIGSRESFVTSSNPFVELNNI